VRTILEIVCQIVMKTSPRSELGDIGRRDRDIGVGSCGEDRGGFKSNWGLEWTGDVVDKRGEGEWEAC